jgi:nucleotide-binding universal stress UspA family protein
MASQLSRAGIVVGVDGSPASDSAVIWASREAQIRDMPILLVHAITPLIGWSETPLPPKYWHIQGNVARRLLRRAEKLGVDAVSGDPDIVISTEVRHGPVTATLVDLSKDAAMLAVGSRGLRTVTAVLLGSVSSALVRHAHCPVAVIHGDRESVEVLDGRPVLVGVDGSAAGERAMDIAFEAASRRHVDLVALHAWSGMGPLDIPRFGWAPIEWRNIEEQEGAHFAECLQRWKQRYPDVTVQSILIADDPIPCLLAQAETAQLVVVGCRGRGGIPGMSLGSVSRAIVHAATVPVIVARGG